MTLIDFRRRLGLTQEELAKALNMARPYLASVENGKYPLSKKLLQKLEHFENSRNNITSEYDTKKAPQDETRMDNLEHEINEIKEQLKTIEILLLKILAK